MFVLVKDLLTGKLKMVQSDDLYVVDNDKYLYEPFKPKSASDFVKKQYYGEIVGDNMILQYVLAMSENEKILRDVLADPRKHKIPNPKRLSASNASIPMKKFKVEKEERGCKLTKNSTKSAKTVHKADAAKSIVSEFVARQSKKKESAVLEKVSSEQDNGVKCEENVKVIEDDSESDPHSSLKRKASAIQETQHENKKPRCKECPVLLKKIEALGKEKEELHTQLETAKKKINDMKSEEKSSIDIKAGIDELKSLKKSIEDVIANSKPSCSLSKLDTMMPQDPESGIPADSIECGGGIILKRKDVAEVELKSEKFSTRLRSLCELFWPNAIHEMHLSIDAGGTLIPESNLESFTTILNSFDWDEDEVLQAYKAAFPKRTIKPETVRRAEPISKILVKSQVRKITYQARVALMTPEEKALRKQQKKKKGKRSGKGGTIKVKGEKKMKKASVAEASFSEKEEELPQENPQASGDADPGSNVSSDHEEENSEEVGFLNNSRNSIVESDSSFLVD